MVGAAIEQGKELAVTAMVMTAGAYGGAIAGEMLGGDLAVTHLGPFAEPLGQGLGRNIGRIVGGAASAATIGAAAGAASIRCPSRSGSRPRNSSVVRFAPEVPVQIETQNFRPYQAPQHGEIQSVCAVTEIPSQSTPPLNDIILALRADSAANTSALTTAMQTSINENNKNMMENMAKMFGMARDDSLQREGVLREEITSTIATYGKDAAGLAAQVTHLTNTVSTISSQLGTNADFSVDAVQQVREEFNARIDAVVKTVQASNAGGTAPPTVLTEALGAGSSKDVPLVNSMGETRYTSQRLSGKLFVAVLVLRRCSSKGYRQDVPRL